MKSVYWKPAIRYVIDKIIVFQDIDFVNIRRNEVKDKVLFSAVKSQMNGKGEIPVSTLQKAEASGLQWF